MALVVKRTELSEESRLADFRFQVLDFAGDSAYQTGGTQNVARTFGFSSIAVMVPIIHSGYVLDYLDTDRLKMWQQSAATGALTEVPNNTNLSAQTFRVMVIGL